MKKDYYFPHEVRTRNDEAVMELIECEGASGYGIYWALMEYLRTQEGYVGKIIAVKTIARQMRTKPYKVDSVLRNYGLFIVNDKTFRSAKLEFVMKPLDDKRKAVEAKNGRNAGAVGEQCTGNAAAVSEQNLDNSLETSSASSKNASLIKKNKEEKSKEDTSSPISSSLAEVAVAVPQWEKYVNELQEDEQWRNSWRCGLDCERNSTLSSLESQRVSNTMSVCWAMKGIFFRPAMPSATSASSSTRAVSPSNVCGKNSIHPPTRASTSMRVVILLRESVRIAVYLYQMMLRLDRMHKRYGMETNGFTKKQLPWK